jgi:hypothetical protein
MAEAETVEGDLIVEVQRIPGEDLGNASRTIDSKTRNLEGVQVKPDHSSRAGKVHPPRIDPQLRLKKISSRKRTRKRMSAHRKNLRELFQSPNQWQSLQRLQLPRQ